MRRRHFGLSSYEMESFMSDDNKRNLLYFEAASMAQLYDCMNNWQVENNKRLLSLSIEKDGGKFCCIGLSNPSEVVIMGQSRSSSGRKEAYVENNALLVTGR